MVLPTFLICGAHKCGTTALFEFLAQHPDVVGSTPKETGFFHEHYDKGWEWLSSHFEGYDGHAAIGEASSLTMAAELAPVRISERLSDAQLLFVLRNPVERAYSQYYYHLYTGKVATPVPFDELIQDQDSDFRNKMIRLGRYDRQIPRFDRCFERDQMKIILHSDLREEPVRAVQEVYDFIGVDAEYVPTLDQHNVTKHPSSPGRYYWLRQAWQPLRTVGEALFPEAAETLRRTARNLLFDRERPEMKPEARAYLRNLYDDTIAWTEQRTGRDLSHWN